MWREQALKVALISSGVAVYGRDLSGDVDSVARGPSWLYRCNDVESLFRAWNSFVDGSAEPGGESQPDRFCRMIECGARSGDGDHGNTGCWKTPRFCGRLCSDRDCSHANRIGSSEAIR
jgi:hypothetical protein